MESIANLPRATGVSRARARNPKKSLPGPLAPGPQKVWKKSRKSPEQTFSRLFPDFFQTSSRLFPDFWGPRETFSRLFFGISGLEVPRDSCSSREGSQGIAYDVRYQCSAGACIVRARFLLAQGKGGGVRGGKGGGPLFIRNQGRANHEVQTVNRNTGIRESANRALVSLRLLNALNSEDRGLKVRFSLATIVFETFELILCQMLSSQGKNAPSNPYPHYLVRLATSRSCFSLAP